VAKKTERQKLVKKLDEIVVKIVKVRDKHLCQYCHKLVEGSNAHCSHVIPRSRGMIYRWDLNNLKLLCYHHHINWWHKDPVEAGKWFREAFPERMAYLDALRDNPLKKYTVADLKELLAKFRNNLNSWKE